MVQSVDDEIEEHAGDDALATHEGQMWRLALPTEARAAAEAVLEGADALTEDLVLDQEADDQQVEVGILARALRAVRVREEVGS